MYDKCLLNSTVVSSYFYFQSNGSPFTLESSKSSLSFDKAALALRPDPKKSAVPKSDEPIKKKKEKKKEGKKKREKEKENQGGGALGIRWNATQVGGREGGRAKGLGEKKYRARGMQSEGNKRIHGDVTEQRRSVYP